ncbi:glycosyltransferase family 2 protein [Macrolepiota fuliginosa MF-IS2]|uniref:chitin synthase n=1 Tax=Macrolepiota fuliginosa MF-IS2 TaxID=1400762 RepID=A0A9P5X4P7_9AGAR|nr:glycosyltransferase family 2 protein [Macrolepiota fuliginosa MF-IS2]
MAANAQHQATASGDLTDLVSSSAQATIYPNDDALLAVLQARFRADLPYSRIGTSNLVVVNPYKSLANVNDVSAREYEERCYKDTALPVVDSPRPLQPHLYEQAAKVYLLMRRRQESQAVLARGITGSGKSSSLRLFVNQILRLSAHSKKEAKVAEQIQALGTLLDSFGNAKTLMNPNASRHGRYLELHFNERGRIASAKVLTYGLDKSRLNRLSHEERTYHVFYQLLAGSTPQERDAFNLEDASDYALLSSSGCYRLPSGPFSDDSIGMGDLRAAMRSLGFKQKHMSSIFSLLVAILLLGNLQFADPDAKDVAAYISTPEVLDQAARLLGVSPEDLTQVLTNKTSYVRKELYTILLNADQAAAQRDHCVRDLYAILFAFVVETANHRLAPSAKDPPSPTQIILLDQPGFQTRNPSGTTSIALTGAAPLISAYGQNGFEEFTINFNDELLHSYILRHSFENVGYNGQLAGDGITLPNVSTMDNGACVELLRGAQLSERAQRKPGGMLGIINKSCSSYKSGKSGDHRDEDLLQEMASKFGVHASYIASPSISGAQDRFLFGINHYAGSSTYDVSGFIEKDSDLLDSAYVTLLRTSSDAFVSKLLSGPSLAAERHSKDENIIVQAQVLSRPLRQPSPILSSFGGTTPSPVDDHPRLDPSKTHPVTTQLNFTLSEIFSTLDKTRLWTISCIRPNDSSSPNSFDKRRVKAQIRALLLPDLVARKSVEYVVDFEVGAFCERYVGRMRGEDEERIRQCVRSNGWREGVDFVVGHRCVWIAYAAWKGVEDQVRAAEKESRNSAEGEEEDGVEDGTEYTHQEAAGLAPQSGYFGAESADNLLHAPELGYAGGGLQTPTMGGGAPRSFGGTATDEGGAWSDWDKKSPSGPGGSPPIGGSNKGILVKEVTPNAVEEVPTTRSRRWWLWMVWATTFWMPGFLLKYVGRMKRPDVQLAWREKVTIFWLIFLLNATIIFYIIEFGRLLCPGFDKAWSVTEVGQHQGQDDYWVAVQGVVYDVSNFVFNDHSDIPNLPSDGPDSLDALAGQDMTAYFPPPLPLACPDLVTDWGMMLTQKNVTATTVLAIHKSGQGAGSQSAALSQNDWYSKTFLPKMREFRKGPLVWDWSVIKAYAADQDIAKVWAVWENGLYDLTDYVFTIKSNTAAPQFAFLDQSISDVIGQRSGQDVTKPLNAALDALDPLKKAQHIDCLKNMFYVGDTDFRKTARCQTQNYMLLIASGILMGSMGLKFLAALQLGSRRSPENQDKFVLCQVPCYTEGEDSLRRTIDSLAALNYDDKRKLIFIICDGNIIGSGNDRTTPRIVLDILGIDPKLDPEPLMFKSVGEGSRAINYGKIYSGLYEFEGHVVPYMVVVKVGKPTERSKPGNRGKRDSQILMLHYLNRVHFDAPMSPLELEIYHQMRNVIGIDPAFYEYIFTVDADTTVTPASLNRLVASCVDDSSIIGICGETKLENEEGSWWTMIQVYEYYISHHLSKAFESLFGSVTCLPGCFSLYRVRTSDKGRPIIISNRIIDEYAEPNVDTLHKKNLFSLGEDRFLTTLLMKHFPTFKTKFCPDAVAHTMAPESWRVLFSQRRRWINSTVHNLCELVLLPELFGFCCFSMRFFVFIDLLGTLILPATVVYLVYLIIVVASRAAAFPRIAIVMLAVVYGLQAIIFILKREFMLVGWMVVYILSYPVYSFFLPVYSFWCMDEFSWGNTRVVVGEGKEKKVLMSEEEKFDESMIPLKKFSEYEAEAWETGSRRSEDTGYESKSRSRHGGRSREESPHTYHQASQAGDYYRDTNLTYNNNSNPNLRLAAGSQASHSNISHKNGAVPMQPMSQYGGGLPQIPFMPFGGPPSVTGGSDYGGNAIMPTMPTLGYQNTGSMYGMPLGGMNMGMGMMGSGSFGGSQAGGFGGVPPTNMNTMGGQRPMSTFSFATSVNPFASPSMAENPTDEELFQALRNYLSTQDLMTVTKKTVREAMASRFPKADLTSRKDFLNQSIDKILSES